MYVMLGSVLFLKSIKQSLEETSITNPVLQSKDSLRLRERMASIRSPSEFIAEMRFDLGILQCVDQSSSHCIVPYLAASFPSNSPTPHCLALRRTSVRIWFN